MAIEENVGKLIVLTVISLCVSAFIWRRILKSESSLWFKLICILISAVPFFGPLLYIFLDPPPPLPPSQQAERMPKGTQVYKDFSPLVAFLKNIFRN
jgi:hypothetical protein